LFQASRVIWTAEAIDSREGRSRATIQQSRRLPE
jgi:hypothetical protein